MFDIIKPILKPKVSGVALGDLLSIAENLLSIANSMLLTPAAWIVRSGIRGNPYLAQKMCQVGSPLDPTGQYLIRFGIEPSIVTKRNIFIDGTIVETSYHKTVVAV